MNTTPEPAEDKIEPESETSEVHSDTAAPADLEGAVDDGRQAGAPTGEGSAAPVADDGAAVADGAPQGASVDPSAEAEALRAELADTKDKMLRALAETENVRRRAQRDKEEASKYAVASFAREIIAVADNFSRAIDTIDQATRESSDAIRNMIVGLEMTERELLGAFERFGVKPIAAEGARFDSNLHEAMFELEDPGKPAGTVVQVLETGYLLHDRLLRPAKVGVSKGGPKAPPPGGDGAGGTGEASEEAVAKSGQQAYEKQGDPGAGSNVDQEL